ncbi:MAG: hypothetical protein JNL01_01985 [Bdellovibrionales bacterium]|nr:hypothetical protein [Bdellovibrionales bacterium]
MKMGTVALVVGATESEAIEPILIESISDELEIATLEAAVSAGEKDPMGLVHELREQRCLEDESFGNYVEELLSRPFIPTEVREHGVEWFKSKNRIESFHRAESEARAVIADFAFKLFKTDPTRRDFILSSQQSEVRVRVFVLSVREADLPGKFRGAA